MIKELLEQSKTIAVVGLSKNTERPAYRVAEYLQSQGYRVIPVNPTVDEVLGEQAYSSLKAVPVPIDIVDIFRRSEEVGPIVDEAIEVGAKAVWLQLGVINEAATRKAEQAGLQVVVDRCTKIEHERLFSGK